MKKIFVIGYLFSAVAFFTACCPVQAVDFSFSKSKTAYAKMVKQDEKSIRDLIAYEIKLANNHDIVGLSRLYSDKFVNNDGFGKDIYFKLVQDTWETYADIKYDTEIKEISVNGKYATVQAVEKAIAISYDEIAGTKTVGELHAEAKCEYHLERVGEKWIFIGENVLSEVSMLKYGDARYLNIQLNSPKQTNADEYYMASLTMQAPENVVAIASINKENITYPQVKSEEAFRVLPEDNILERMFKANSDNVNEYNIASVATAHSFGEGEDMKVVMSGAAFIMSRVNVVPKNKFIDYKEEDNAKTK